MALIAPHKENAASACRLAEREVYPKYRDKDKRRTYMRDYMRKRRGIPAEIEAAAREALTRQAKTHETPEDWANRLADNPPKDW